jgi:chromosome segregation ATPase
MKQLLAIIAQAIAFISSLRANTKDLHAALEEKDAKLNEQASTIDNQANVIANLHAQIAVNAVDDEELKKAAADAKAAQQAAQEAADAASARTVELQATLDELNNAGEELRAAINDEAKAPNVDEHFNVIDPNAPAAPVKEESPEATPEESTEAEPSADLTKPTDGETAAE